MSGSGSSPQSQVATYAGNSGHNLHKRLDEHAQSVYRRDKKSALSKHHVVKHPQIAIDSKSDIDKIFSASVIKGGFRFNVNRYVNESIQIDKFNNDPSVQLLNNKSEWGNNRVRRLQNG